MREYELHPEAYNDLHEIGQYIADDSPAAAKRGVDEIFDAIAALVPFPQQGHRRTDLTSRPLRFIRVYDYLIAYAPDEKPLWVVAVFHGHRRPLSHLPSMFCRECLPSWPRFSEVGKINPVRSVKRTY